MKKCDYCAEEIADEAIYCRFCNHDLAPKETSKKKSMFTAGLISSMILILISIIVISSIRDNKNLGKILENNLLIATMTSEIFVRDNQLSTSEFYQSNLLSTQHELKELVDQYNGNSSTLTVENNLLLKTVENQNTQISVLTNLECFYEDFKPDFSSNVTMAASLRNYVEDNIGNVIEASHEAIWSNVKDSKHRFLVKKDDDYLGLVFVVYFDHDGLGNGVFFMNRRCWIDR